MPLFHYGLPVGAHFEEMKAFYTAILEPLGYTLMVSFDGYCGFGTAGGGPPDFWLGGGRKDDGLSKYDGNLEGRIAPIHIAFDVESQGKVDEVYENSIKVGAFDNGKPGMREHYAPKYYAAFVLDPLGNNIEFVNCPA